MMCFQALPIPNEYWAQNENVSLDNVGSFQDKLVESKYKYVFLLDWWFTPNNFSYITIGSSQVKWCYADSPNALEARKVDLISKLLNYFMILYLRG
jgi:hypothetical protein